MPQPVTRTQSPASYRFKVQVQADTGATVDAAGGHVAAWTNVGDPRWMSVEPLGGRELYLAQQVQPEATIRIRTWWFDGLTAKHRLVYGTRVFQILNVSDTNEWHRELVIDCRELTPAA
jgi:SPP1 family predicted phage head-tail adaptor